MNDSVIIHWYIYIVFINIRLAPEDWLLISYIFIYLLKSKCLKVSTELSYKIIKLFTIINYFQLTYVIYSKERRQVRSAEDLKITDKMKEKAGDYVRKKMNNYGKEYKRSPTKE